MLFRIFRIAFVSIAAVGLLLGALILSMTVMNWIEQAKADRLAHYGKLV